MLDLVLVDALDRSSIVGTVAALITTGDIARAFDIASPDGDRAEGTTTDERPTGR